jgi:hypothetical protein
MQNCLNFIENINDCFSDIVKSKKRESFDINILDLGYIFSVVFRQYDMRNIGPFGSKYLLLYSAHRQNTAPKGISPVMAIPFSLFSV